jgi:hypothetical protein
VLHRDLKPENVLLNSCDDLVISDFGLGLLLEQQGSRFTTTGASFGTLDYMAPEQTLSRKNADARSDIYSLGQMLYELYTGNVNAAFYDFNGIPNDIAVIVERCTQQNPDRRFPSVDALLDSFTLIQSSDRRANAEEELRHLGGIAAAGGSLTSAQAKEFVALIAQCKDEGNLLHEVAIQLPEAAFRELYSANPELTRLFVSKFAEMASGQGWPFAYTDRIGAACARIYAGVDDPASRGLVAATALTVGVGHNRWDVMATAASLISKATDSVTARAVAAACEPHRSALSEISDRLTISRLHPALHSLFEPVPEPDGGALEPL